MGVAVVMAMFASEELGPMTVPVTAKELVGTWRQVGSSSKTEGGLLSEATITFRADGTRTAVTKERGPPRVHTGTYTVGKGTIRIVSRPPEGGVHENTVFVYRVRGGRICFSLNGSSWDMFERVNKL